MQQSLKYARETLRGIEYLKSRHECFEKELARLGGKEPCEQTKKFYDVIANITEEISSLPIGYRYTGIFYIKKAYTCPVGFEKITASIFMREDLSYWIIENDDKERSQTYFRTVFKEPNIDAVEIKREDAVLGMHHNLKR